MQVYGVPRDLSPYGLPFETMVLGDPAYATGSFDAFVELEAIIATREAHMQEETGRALAREREIWQKDREVLPW